MNVSRGTSRFLAGPKSTIVCAVVIGVFAFLLYSSSLSSNFVYDAYVEIKEEGFITDFSNLPQVLSLAVLKAKLMLGPRPGQMLYMMLIARLFGENPFWYHLFSNILHSLNAVLLFLLCLRLLQPNQNDYKCKILSVLVSLVFAAHPIVVESVAEISYSSVLLVMFFTLSGLLVVSEFDKVYSGPLKYFLLALGWGIFSFCAISCKESGIEACLVFFGYMLLFDKNRSLSTKILIISPAIFLSAAFLIARLSLSPKDPYFPSPSLATLRAALINQPRLWDFMSLKILYPGTFSADYTAENWELISPMAAWVILIVWGIVQYLIARKLRMFAFGVIVFWANLIAVSNFFPLTRVVADRFYYLSLGGFLIQVLGITEVIKSRNLVRILVVSSVIIVPYLCWRSYSREKVFHDQMSLWEDTARVSPMSISAHNGLGLALYEIGDIPGAIKEYFLALTLDPEMAEARVNLAVALMHQGNIDEALKQLSTVIYFRPNNWQAHANLGFIYSKQGRIDAAARELASALSIQPREPQIDNYYGNILLLRGDSIGALDAFEASSEKSRDAESYYNIGNALAEAKKFSEAVEQYRKALKFAPFNPELYNNLANALSETKHSEEAIQDYKQAIQLSPGFAEAYDNLGLLLLDKKQYAAAMKAFRKAVELKPGDPQFRHDLDSAGSVKKI